MEEDRSSKFSPSKLDVYKRRARRYRYRYVDRIARARKTPETAVGVAVHAAFEQMYGLVSGGKSPSLADVCALYDEALDREWDGTIALKDARFTRDDWKKVGRDCVASYHAAHAPFNEDRTVAVEKRVGFPLVVEGHQYRIEGFVDRLSLAPDGAFEIHDYKTAKSLPGQEKADADWQLALYEIAVRREWPDARIAAFAQAAGVTTVAGEAAEASVAIKEEIRLPTRTKEPDKHEALEDDARREPRLWSDVARLDAHVLLEGVRSKRWAGALLAAAEGLVERYGRREIHRSVRLRRREAEEE